MGIVRANCTMSAQPLARSKSGLTSSSVPIGLPLPNVQLALEKVRCLIHEESEWRGSAYQKKI